MADICLECINGFDLQNGLCVCPKNTFEISNSCLPCNDLCYECTDATPQSCSSCKENFLLIGSTCICNPSFYLNSSDSSCYSCHQTCYPVSENFILNAILAKNFYSMACAMKAAQLALLKMAKIVIFEII